MAGHFVPVTTDESPTTLIDDEASIQHPQTNVLVRCYSGCDSVASLAFLSPAKHSFFPILDDDCNSNGGLYRAVLDAGGLVHQAPNETTLADLDVAVFRPMGFSMVCLREMGTSGVGFVEYRTMIGEKSQ
jgi:hypothetical protein